MKKLTVAAIVLTASVAQAESFGSHGSSFGTFATAKSQGQGNGTFGIGVGIADNTSVVGWLNYGLSEYVDGRIKLGLVDADGGDTEVTLGADFKYQFWSVGSAPSNALDLAAGGFFEFVDYGPFSVLQLGGQILGSYPFHMRNGSVLSPYGRFNVRLERLSWDRGFGGRPTSDSESDLDFGFNGGVQWQVVPTVGLYGEFQIDGNDGIFLGIDFSVL